MSDQVDPHPPTRDCIACGAKYVSWDASRRHCRRCFRARVEAALEWGGP